MPDDRGWQRRVALQIAAQLPENLDDALAVLHLTKELVEVFLGAGQARAPGRGSGEVVAFSAAAISSRSASGNVSILPK